MLLDIKAKIKNKCGDNCLSDFSRKDNLPISLNKNLVTKFYKIGKIRLINKIKEEKESKIN